ncbi:hypothetical protein Pfo_017260 [Paulownia fortunei]|nr:hypothetical protein Pfo_017260 [Paulownia fortunei]
MSIASSMFVAHKSTGLQIKSNLSSQGLHSTPVSKLAISKCKDEMSFWGNKTRLQYCDIKTKRHSFAVYATGVQGAPLPSGPPPSSSIKSWILGIVVSLVLPFFTHKWGPIWVLKNRIENAVETVEQIVEVVEKVAEEVDKIAEDIGDDLPQGKLKNLVDFVEDMAEKTAKSADSIGDLIDRVCCP